MRFTLTRDFYIPKGATKIADKISDAVAYISTNSKGKPRATIFIGKQAKPISDYWYKDEDRRNAAVGLAFESRRKSLAFKSEIKAKRTSWEPDYKVGELLRTCWGYDQTNVEYFEVVEVKGKHVILREIAQERVDTGWLQGKCVPLPGQYLTPRYEGDDRGQPLRRLAQEGGVRICNVRWASRCKPEQVVGGVPVYSAASWSNYH